MRISWNKTKKAQACGVGGKAEVIGIAEVPLGIAGVNGLMELTVIKDDVPLLLPIKLLKQLKAVVNLDDNILELRTYQVKAPLTELPSGHVSVGVTEFAPGGWKLPHDALSASLQHEKFVCATSGYLNHSMIELEKAAVAPPAASSGHGVASPGADAGAARGYVPDPPEDVGIRGKEQTCDASLAAGGRKAGRLDGAPEPSRKSAGLAAKFIVAALGFQAVAGGPISFYPKCPGYSGKGQEARQPAGVRGGDQACGLPWSEAEQGQTGFPDIRVQASPSGAQGRGEPVPAGDLLQPVQRPLGTPDAGGASEAKGCGEKPWDTNGEQLHDCRTDGSEVSVRQERSPLGGEEEGTDPRKTLLSMPKPRVRFLPVGPGRAAAGQGADGMGRQSGGEAARGSPKDPEPGRGPCAVAGPGDAAHDAGAGRADEQGVPGPHGGAGQQASTRIGGGSSTDGLDARVSCPGSVEPGSPVGRIQFGVRSFSVKGLPDDVESEQVSLISSSSQSLTARRLQMRAFCPGKSSIPWRMSLPRSFFVWDEPSQEWKERSGWLPRSFEPPLMALVCYDDKDEMAIWSQEHGVCKALTHGQRKKMSRSLNAMTQSFNEDENTVWKLVSPEFDASVFQCQNEVMANLDLLRTEPLWDDLGVPKRLVIFPDQTERSSALAVEVAEWQDAGGRSFVILFEAEPAQEDLCQLMQDEGWMCQSKD